MLIPNKLSRHFRRLSGKIPEISERSGVEDPEDFDLSVGSMASMIGVVTGALMKMWNWPVTDRLSFEPLEG
jgi:hypothetical protein